MPSDHASLGLEGRIATRVSCHFETSRAHVPNFGVSPQNDPCGTTVRTSKQNASLKHAVVI